MRTTSSLFLLSLLFSISAPLVAAAPASRVPSQKGMLEYCALIKLALKRGESVQPNSDNTDRFYLSVDMLTKANALCDAMLSAPSPTTTSSVDTQKIQQGMVGYCFLIRAALNKSIDVVPSEQNQDKFNLSVDVITKTDALCGAMLTPPPPQKGLFGYCTLINIALKLSESVMPSQENQSRFDLTVDLLKKASALCGAMKAQEDQ